ncbi:hypothetical protein ITI46_17640 [Streptomyces oryzae]|uniref:FlgD Ig-like domain-containing protein n=1 Tax=Streptomyces oryzae TaxID=1434886 RepID=A0ABS3XDL0_9ACTN|nr:hypothetical protein [Streptomyces oryzae]MBO8193466.1 hypothetical protein [Streptomyces oryzae]
MNVREEWAESEAGQRLGARLRAAAEAHQPDRARMLERIAHGTDECGARRRTRRTRAPRVRAWPRAAGAFVVVLAIGGATALWAQQGDGHTAGDGPAPTVRSTSPGPARSEDGEGSGGTGAADRTGTLPASDGPLRSSGSLSAGGNDYWSQTEVTVRTGKPLTALTVELRIAENSPLSSTGSWRTRPSRDFDIAVRHAGGALVYRWKLKEGRTVPPGRHVFAGQYDHGTGARRSMAGDRYTVSATADGRAYQVGGGIG